MSEKGFGMGPDNSQGGPDAKALELLNQIGQDLAEANREVRLAKGMMDQATRDNDPEALVNWEKRFTGAKKRADELAVELAVQVPKTPRSIRRPKAEIDPLLDISGKRRADLI